MGYGGNATGTGTPGTLEDLRDFRPFLNPEIVAEPHPVYARLRAEAPVLATDVGVVLSRHDDVMHALRHPELFASDMDAVHLGNDRPLIPLQIDPPHHLRYRKILDPLFAPREVNRLEHEVRTLTNQLVDAFVDTGEVEYASAVAVPLPCTVFLALMGLPQEELAYFLSLKDGIIRPEGGFGAPDSPDAQRATGREIYAYFGQAVADRRAHPRDDLITRFTVAEVEGDRLSDDEILDICFLFIMAGLDTVTASLGCSMAYLARHAEARRALAADPGLVPGAVEELLRSEGVVPGSARMCAQDTEIDGVRIEKGTPVHLLIASANLDPGEFPDPERVDFAREGNRHLAFGGGVHRCLGSHLARLELRVALEEWHRRIPEYAIAPGSEPVYITGLRAVEHLPLVFPRGGK